MPWERQVGGAGQEGWLRPQLGRGHTCVPASVGLFPSPLREYWARCNGLSLSSCGWFGQLWLRYEEALCSLGSPVCTVERQVWSVKP